MNKYKVGLILFIGLVAGIFASTTSLNLKVNTANSGTSNDNQFTLPIQAAGAVDCVINWGDGNSETVTANGAITHTYAANGIYTIEIEATSFPGIAFAYSGDRDKLTEISQWGNIQWNTLNSAFFGCSNVNFTATDIPDWSLVTDFTFAFTNCFAITDNFAGYNVSSGQSFLWAWAGCVGITDFASLNFAAATSLEKAWYLCSNLQTFGNISIPNCTSLRETWWTCSALTAYPVITNSASVTDAAAAFVNLTIPTTFPATNFSNVIDFEGTWWGNDSLTTFNDPGMSKGQNLFEAFRNCWVLTTIPILDLRAMTDGGGCFRNVTLDTDIWSQILKTTQANSTVQNVTFSGGNSKHSLSAHMAIDDLETNSGWTITDGGMGGFNEVITGLSSVVSPAHVEGNNLIGQSVTINGIAATALDTVRWYGNATLSSTTATSIDVVIGPETFGQSVTWDTSNIVDSGSITIRQGDSLLLTAISATLDGAVEIDGDGNGSYELTGIEGDKFATAFNTAGSYSVIVKIGGQVAGTLVVNVIGVDYQGSIACEIAYNRVKDIDISNGDNSIVTFTGNEFLDITSQVSSATGSTINLTPLSAGSPVLAARLGGEYGPVISTIAVDEFTLTSQATTYIGVIEEYADGSILIQTKLEMLPKVTGLQVDLNIFVSGVTFIDSTLNKTLMTDDFDTQTPALYPYQMIMNNGVVSGSCHTVKIYQNSVQIGN